MLLKVCPRCKRLIPHGLPYCTDCAPVVEAAREAKRERRAEYMRKKYNRTYNQSRDPKYAAFYRSSDWKATSRAKLSAVGYKCEAKLEGCQGIATEVHHMKPIKTDEGWVMRLEWDGLQAVCTACHNQLDRRGQKKRTDPCVIDMREVTKNL